MARKKDHPTKLNPTPAASRSKPASATVPHSPPPTPAPKHALAAKESHGGNSDNALAKLEFPLAVLASFVVSSVLYRVFVEGKGGLGGVSRRVDSWGVFVGLVGWRAAEVGVGWFGGLDGRVFLFYPLRCLLALVESCRSRAGGRLGEYIVQDVAMFTLLSHLPQVYLLTMFYRIHVVTAIQLIAIDLLSVTVPFSLFRRLSPSQILTSFSTTLSSLSIPITLLTSSIYALITYASFLTWAPTHLAAHFYGLRDISPVHGLQFPHLVCLFLPAGIAATAFIYNSAATVAPEPDTGVALANPYDPMTETLWKKLVRENWTRLTPRTKELVKRTAAVIVVGGGKSWLHTWATLNGVDAFGAAGYAGIFELGALVTGLVYWWIGDV